MAEQYIRAEVLLPRRDLMARGHVVVWSHDANGNVLGRANASPILDTKMYQVEFAGGEITELTVNVIAASIYDYCDAYGNVYSFLDLLSDYQKEDKLISLSD